MAWSRERSTSACFDSAAPMKPTGQPTIAAGRGAPAISISIRWKSAVGALPTATTAPASQDVHRETAAAVRVVAHSAASPGTRGSLSRQSTSLSRGNRLRVTPVATMVASHRIGAPPSSAVRAERTRSGWTTMSSARST